MNTTDTAPDSLPVATVLRTDLTGASRPDLATRLARSYQNFASTAEAVIKEYVDRGLTMRDLATDLQEAGWTGSLKRLQNIQSQMRQAGLLPAAKQGRRRDLEQEVPARGNLSTAGRGFGSAPASADRPKDPKQMTDEEILDVGTELIRDGIRRGEEVVRMILNPATTDDDAAFLWESIERNTSIEPSGSDSADVVYGIGATLTLQRMLAIAISEARDRETS